jgi:hypothetical protein
MFPAEEAAEISISLLALGRPDLSQQMRRVVIPRQTLAGSADSFSFLAYPWPRLTYDERMAIELRDCERVKVELTMSTIAIDMDDFGQINWFYVERFPALFSAISLLL